MTQDPPRLRAISHHSGKIVSRLVIRMRAEEVRHRLLARSEMDGSDCRCVPALSFGDGEMCWFDHRQIILQSWHVTRPRPESGYMAMVASNSGPRTSYVPRL